MIDNNIDIVNDCDYDDIKFKMEDGVSIDWEYRDEFKEFDGTPKEYREYQRIGEFSDDRQERRKAKRQLQKD